MDGFNGIGSEFAAVLTAKQQLERIWVGARVRAILQIIIGNKYKPRVRGIVTNDMFLIGFVVKRDKLFVWEVNNIFGVWEGRKR